MKEILDWLNNETTRIQAYHNHKENMAWVATVLHLTGTVTLGFILRRGEFVCPVPLVLILYLLVSCCAGVFIYWQFHNRMIAAQKVEGILRTIIDLHSKQEITENQGISWEFNPQWVLPCFVVKNIPPKTKFIGVILASELVTGIILAIAIAAFILLVVK